jgi:hypothetical protein
MIASPIRRPATQLTIPARFGEHYHPSTAFLADRSIVQTYLYSWVVTSCVDEMQINKVTEWRGHRVAR